MKIAAIADLHCRAGYDTLIEELLGEAAAQADLFAIAGDLTDTGLIEEAETLIPQLRALEKPVIVTLGNHDHESGNPEEIIRLLRAAGIIVLDGTAHEIDGVGFIGTKGFCGGFDDMLVQPFGEESLKKFIRTAIDEAVTLENALAKLDSEHTMAILHYSPIKKTLEGEPLELWPFLGTSRLANALDRRGVDVIIHGHAHYGSPQGLTPGQTPVHNVCRFVQERHTGSPYCMIEL